MGAIGGLLGLSGGAAGTGFAAPSNANIAQGVSTSQASNAYEANQVSLAQQQALLQALQNQNGFGNQNQALQQQQNLYSQLAAAPSNLQGALQSQQGLAAQQQATAQQYQNLANGIGPNPAQAQLAQNTAANVAQTGALMAGQRGASQNVGLLARQAGQAGAQAQQQSVGQAATLQAQQQLAGLSGLSAQQQNIGQTQANVGQLSQAQLAAQQAQLSGITGLANTQVANQLGQTNAITGAQQAEQANILNSLGQLNNANVGMQSNINSVQGQLANTQLQGQHGVIGGVLNAIGGGASGAKGGEVKNYDEGGDVPTFGSDAGSETSDDKKGGIASLIPLIAMLAPGGMAEQNESAYPGQSAFGQYLSQVQAGGSPDTNVPGFGSDAGAKELEKGTSQAIMGPLKSIMGGMGGAKGGQVDYRGGGKVNAANSKQKAVKKGDNYSNDKIPAVLSEHEIVLPRSVTLSKDPVKAAGAFVAATLAKRRGNRR